MKRLALAAALAAAAIVVGFPTAPGDLLAQGAWQPPSPPPRPPSPPPRPPSQPTHIPRPAPRPGTEVRRPLLGGPFSFRSEHLEEADSRADRIVRYAQELDYQMARIGTPRGYLHMAESFERAAVDLQGMVHQMGAWNEEMLTQPVLWEHDQNRLNALRSVMEETVRVLKEMERLQDALAQTALP